METPKLGWLCACILIQTYSQAPCQVSEIQYLLSCTNVEVRKRQGGRQILFVLLQTCSANNARNYESATSFSRAAFCCNMCVIGQFIMTLTAAIISIAVYFDEFRD